MHTQSKAITTAVLVSLLPLCGQSPIPHSNKKSSKIRTTATNLESFDNAKMWGGLSKLSWDLNIHYGEKKEEVYTALKSEAMLQNPLFFENEMALKPYIKQIEYAITQLGSFDDSISYYIVNTINKPFRLVKYNNKKCISAYVFTDTIYNTLKFPTKRKLASKIVNTNLVPAIRSLGDSFENTDIFYVSLFLIYGTKDFSDDSVLSIKPEVINITAAVSDLKQFASNMITDSELVKRCNILISDRNSSSDFIKILVDTE